MNSKKGYPSIDKPHYKYYKDTPTRNIDTEQTVYDLVFSSNKDNMYEPALEYLGVEWSFEKLKKETDRAASAFFKSGLKMGDVVLIGVSNSFETVVTLLALNKIGVVSKWFDIRASEKDIKEYANESNCKYIIAFDMLLPKINAIIDETSLTKAIIINPTNSLSLIIKTAYSLKNKNKIPNDERFVSFGKFVKSGDLLPLESVPFDKNRPSIMIQSSGTTGKAKNIVHSDFSVTSCVQKLAFTDMPVGRGKALLVLLPPWIAYALGNSIIFSLSLGCKTVLSPTFEREKILDYLGKFTVCFTAPVIYRYLVDNYDNLTKKQKEGIRKIECLCSGGDKITVEENNKFESILNTVVVNGYGNNEGWGALTVNPVQSNKYGTVGIPKYGDVIISYNSETNTELGYGETGELCVLTDTMFLHYEGKEEETKSVKKIHPDGQCWLHTGDLGFIDEDGYITLNGRTRRVIVRAAFKISAYTIEDIICEHPAVKECVAVEVYDKREEHVPMAFIVLNDNCDAESMKKEIQKKCEEELKNYEVPKYFEIVDSLPYTPNGKYDFRELEKIGNDIVNSL